MWLFALVLSAPSAAQDPSDPAAQQRGMELYQNGVILYDEGRYDDAIVAWQEGYRLTARPGFLYNIANAQERIGDYAGAIDTLGRYRALARAEERETLDRRIRNLEERLAAAPPTGVAAVAAPAPVAPARGDRPLRPLIGGSLVGAGVVGLGVGTGFGLASRAAGTEAAGDCRESAGLLLCPSGSAGALAVNRRAALVADVAFGLGVALGASGAGVLLLGGGEDPGKPGPVGLRLGPGGLVVSGGW